MISTLSVEERLDRQRADQRLVAALDASDCPIRATGHRTAEDARAGRSAVAVEDRAPATHYRVVYDFDTLRGPDRRHRPTVVHISPLASAGYPATPPTAWVVSDVIPWTPHFAASVPICHGSHEWIPNRTQLADYIIHIGRLLNFDEPPPSPGYHGYNGEAVAYWRNAMQLQPLDPGLKFPVISPDKVLRPPVFKAATPTDGTRRFRGTEASLRRGRFRSASTGAPRRFGPAGARS